LFEIGHLPADIRTVVEREANLEGVDKGYLTHAERLNKISDD
jgi:hypothetical protein